MTSYHHFSFKPGVMLDNTNKWVMMVTVWCYVMLRSLGSTSCMICAPMSPIIYPVNIPRLTIFEDVFTNKSHGPWTTPIPHMVTSIHPWALSIAPPQNPRSMPAFKKVQLFSSGKRRVDSSGMTVTTSLGTGSKFLTHTKLQLQYPPVPIYFHILSLSATEAFR